MLGCIKRTFMDAQFSDVRRLPEVSYKRVIAHALSLKLRHYEGESRILVLTLEQTPCSQSQYRRLFNFCCRALCSAWRLPLQQVQAMHRLAVPAEPAAPFFLQKMPEVLRVVRSYPFGVTEAAQPYNAIVVTLLRGHAAHLTAQAPARCPPATSTTKRGTRRRAPSPS